MRSPAATVVALAGSFVVTAAAPATAENAVLGPSTTLYVDPASTTLQAAAKLDAQARANALALGSFPSATWFTKGTPAEVQAAVKKLVDAAATKTAVPIVVPRPPPRQDKRPGAPLRTLRSGITCPHWLDGRKLPIGLP